jgi:nucleoid DNA-binding protein
MTAPVKLYAWAVPGFFSTSPVDHTWVTTYDNRTDLLESVQRVIGAKQCFWFCWGDFHSRGGTPASKTGFLGEVEGDLAQARCLVQPNVNSKDVQAARGTIFRYARDGVCHQLANQVLYATGEDGAQPLTVAGARGYMFSSFRYGTYGVDDAAWRKKLDACGPRGRKTGRERGRTRMKQKPDDFETRAREVLKGQNLALLPKLLALRTQTQRLSGREWSKTHMPTAEEINARNQEMFDRAAELLGHENFQKIFGAPAYEEVNLVDPQFLSDPEVDRPTGGPTVTLKHLAAALAKDNSLSRKQAEAILGGLVGKIVKHLKKGERIRIGGLGVLQVRKRAARVGRNPATGERIQIKASKKVAFRASKELKEAI